MCDAGTVKVKKNTTNNNSGNLSPNPLLLIMSRGMAYSRYVDDPCAALLRDSLVNIPHNIIRCQAFLQSFLKFFRKIFSADI